MKTGRNVPRLWLASVISWFLSAACFAQAVRDLSYNAISAGPRSPEDERRGFVLPEGFEVELVAAESEVAGKFISVAWDARMRLWTMTAFEYPVDANENKEASDALFARGGRDRVLVYDSPYGPAPARPRTPRVFADGLVMPLGIQPYRDGVFVQYGPDIRLYRDTDGDGRAERHEVVLTGFGTEDSHLFPHQFLRQPGGWMFVAQGAFNYSTVRRPGGRPFADGSIEASFNQCKLGRFQLDGSRWENLTAGPMNIWGLTTSREGETFLQEANDMGYPVIPYEPGIHVPTNSSERLRPYQPLMPRPLDPPQMGGTGLSGLALAEDGDGFFRRVGEPGDEGTKVFFLANPIMGAIQVVRATPEHGRYHYEKRTDFMTSSDRWFRPVALHFGPDGGLYIVDWYNKIISHNEVPRVHPDRDKARGRIWRVRHQQQARTPPPDLTQLDDPALLDRLGDANALVARLAWLEIVDRKAITLAPQLEKLAADRSVSSFRRLGALWALEGLKTIDSALLRILVVDPDPAIRREAARLAAAQPRAEAEFLAVAILLIDDEHRAVRVAVGDALRRVPNASARVMSLAARLGREPVAGGSDWDRYEREFERYLARWAMELNPGSTRAWLHSAEGRAFPLENRLLACLALGGRDSAIELASHVSHLKRALSVEEVRLLARHFDEPAVSEVFGQVLAAPASQVPILRTLLGLRTTLDTTRLVPALTTAARRLLKSADVSEVTLGADVAVAFKLAGAESELSSLLKQGWETSGTPGANASQPRLPLPLPSLAALRALRESGVGSVALFETIARESTENAVREEALGGLAASIQADAAGRLVALFPHLSPTQRGTAIHRLSGKRTGAEALLTALNAGVVTRSDIGLSTADRLKTVLPDDPRAAALWRELGGEGKRVLRLESGGDDFVAAGLTLAGPFTFEFWVRLESGEGGRAGVLGAPGMFAIGFEDWRLCIRSAPTAERIVSANKPSVPDTWMHRAVTRDDQGVFRIFVGGELDATSAKGDSRVFADFDLGRWSAAAASSGRWLMECRVWSVTRSVKEIRENFDRSYADVVSGGSQPAELVAYFDGSDWGRLNGHARLELREDAPILLTEVEAGVQAEKFARYRSLASVSRRGSLDHGREMFTTLCLACHQQGNKGGQIGPALDVVGLTGVEAILRNVLTPNAAMESAYRILRVVMNDGSIQEGFLSAETDAAIVLRTPGAEDRRILRRDIRQTRYLRRSLMPESLLESLPDDHVVDLFAYLKTLL